MSTSDTAPLTPKPTRSYLHPNADVKVNEASCDSENDPYVTIRITNHSTHDMDYDIQWDETTKAEKVTGAAEGVFSLVRKQVPPGERLFDSTGKCGPQSARPGPGLRRRLVTTWGRTSFQDLAITSRSP